jgi:hypothetical protein
MKCLHCGNEVFCLSKVKGEPSLYCAECGLTHYLDPVPASARIAADSSTPTWRDQISKEQAWEEPQAAWAGRSNK